MSTFVLIPGAGGIAWYWHRVVPLLEQAGHSAVAVDLPADDDTSGLPEYAERVVAAAADRSDVVLVASSMGAFTAPMAAAQLAVVAMTLMNAMIPLPGETPGEWWGHTQSEQARVAAAEQGGYDPVFDPASPASADTYFMHDVPTEVAATGAAYQRQQSPAVFGSVCAFQAWPPVPIHVVAGREDRFLPVELQRRVARDRLGLEIDVLPGGHLVALSQPAAVADYLMTTALTSRTRSS
jgi:pimeloyl-ACP methyl ester carboxylesterase